MNFKYQISNIKYIYQNLKFLKHFKFYIVIFIFAFCILHLPFPVYAANPCPAPAQGVQIKDCFGFGSIVSLGQGTSKLVTPIFSIAAVLIIIYFLIGAFKYLKAGANKEDVEGGRQMITHAITGFIILMFSFLILQFLLFRLFGVTNLQIIQTL